MNQQKCTTYLFFDTYNMPFQNLFCTLSDLSAATFSAWASNILARAYLSRISLFGSKSAPLNLKLNLIPIYKHISSVILELQAQSSYQSIYISAVFICNISKKKDKHYVLDIYMIIITDNHQNCRQISTLMIGPWFFTKSLTNLQVLTKK